MSETGARRKGLGRGLAALMEDIAAPEAAAPRPADASLPVDRIRPNPGQPRKRFPEEELEALAASIRARGVIQPLIVRPDPTQHGCWQIVAGERRWRAAQRAQLHSVPVVVRELGDSEALELAILENVQREDLNAVDEAAGYADLIERFDHTQQQLAEGLGKSRSHIANALRLLTLPEEVRGLVQDGRLSAGHARALIGSPDPAALARRVLAGRLSVRETERLARQAAVAVPRSARPQKDPDTRALEADLAAAIELPVGIRQLRAGGGEITIRYRDLDQLDGLCRLLMK